MVWRLLGLAAWLLGPLRALGTWLTRRQVRQELEAEATTAQEARAAKAKAKIVELARRDADRRAAVTDRTRTAAERAEDAKAALGRDRNRWR